MQILEADVVLPITKDPISPGAVVIDGNRICDIGPQDQIRQKYPGQNIKALRNAAIMPGLINCHTHLQLSHFQPQLLGTIFDPDFDMPKCARTFVDWLIALIVYRRELKTEMIRDAISFGIKKSIAAGTTCIAEITNLESEFAFFRGQETRVVVFPELISFNPNQAQELYDNAYAMIESEDLQGPLISVGISPHSPYTVSRSLLKITGHLVRETKIPLQIHASESFAEMEFFFDAKGEIATKLFPLVGWDDMTAPCHRKTPIQYLSSIEFLSPYTSLVHCVHITDSDLDNIAKAGTGIIHCPRSNFFLSNGRSPLEKILDRPIRVGLGTDSLASNTSLSLWDEMRFTKLIHERSAKKKISSSKLLEMATINGAHLLTKAGEIGSIEAGKKADIIGINIESRKSGTNIEDFLVENTFEKDVVMVMIDGSLVKEE